MKIKDKAKPKIPPVSPGVYLAVCVGVIDLGEQYKEKFKTYSNVVKFIWELSGEYMEVDGEQKPRQLSRDFTISSSKKSNLRGFLSSWNGKQYSDDEFTELELFDQLGKVCQLNVVLNDTGEYANVDNIMPLPKGIPVPTTETSFLRWDMDHWNDDEFVKLPEWCQDRIKKSTEYQKFHAPETTVDFREPETERPAEPAGEEVCPI